MSISRIQLLALVALPALASPAARASDDEGGHTPFIESIYNFRSVRLSRTAPTAFCNGLGFPVLFEDTFDAWSYATRGKDGLVVNTARQKIGAIRLCLGFKSNPPLVLNFYAEFDFGGLHVTGMGLCTRHLLGFPVAGADYYICNFTLASPGYIGGQLVTSTAAGPSAIVAGDTNVFGIHETSFATVRLWRQRGVEDEVEDKE